MSRSWFGRAASLDEYVPVFEQGLALRTAVPSRVSGYIDAVPISPLIWQGVYPQDCEHRLGSAFAL